MKVQSFYESEYFEIGQCAFPVLIEYTETLPNYEGEIDIVSCMIEVAGDDKNQVWAKVESEYFPKIEKQLLEVFEQEASDKAG